MVRESLHVCHSPCIPIPIPIPSKFLVGGKGVNHSSHDFPAKKQETEQVVRNRMEEETGRKKQAEAWGAALLVSAQSIPFSSVPVSAVGGVYTYYHKISNFS